MKKLLCLVLGVVISISGFNIANAAPKKPRKTLEEVFKELDTDQDEKLSIEEFVASKTGRAKTSAEKRFKAKDKDKDGSLTFEEFSGKKLKKKNNN